MCVGGQLFYSAGVATRGRRVPGTLCAPRVFPQGAAPFMNTVSPAVCSLKR